MGPLGVVGRKPLLGDRAHLVEGVEEVRVEDLFAKRAIEPRAAQALTREEPAALVWAVRSRNRFPRLATSSSLPVTARPGRDPGRAAARRALHLTALGERHPGSGAVSDDDVVVHGEVQESRARPKPHPLDQNGTCFRQAQV